MADFIDHHFVLWVIVLEAAIFLSVMAVGCVLALLLQDRGLAKHYVRFSCIGFVVVSAICLILYFCGVK